MNVKKVMVSIMFFIFVLCNGEIYAQVKQVGGSGSLGIFSDYVWRGQKLGNNLVIQPSVEITYNNFKANLWANYDTDLEEHTETDLTLSYSFPIERFSLETGYIYYALEGAEDTQEIYLSVSLELMLNPTLSLYYDFDEGKGGFIVGSIGHSFELARGMSLNLGASISYNINNEVMGTNSKGDDFCNFYNGELSLSISIPVASAINIEPMVAYSFPISSDAEDAIEAISKEGDTNFFYGGVTISLSF